MPRPQREGSTSKSRKPDLASVATRPRQEKVGQLVEELQRHPLLRQKWLVRNESRFRLGSLAELLLQLSQEEWHRDPEQAEELAELGLEVAEQIGEAAQGPGAINDLKARAWCFIANARRIRSHLRSVEEAFRAAEFYLERGTGNAVERAVFLSLKSSYRRDQRRFDEAAELLGEAAEIYRGVGNVSQQAFVLLQSSVVLRESGQYESAAETLRAAIGLLKESSPRDQQQRLSFYAHHNLAICLNEMGQTLEAQKLLPTVRELARRSGEKLDRLRVDWLEGLIQVNAGRFDEGESVLRQVRDRFMAEDIGYDAALVSLDLALLYLRKRRAAKAKQLAVELVPIFESRDVRREALAALLIIQQALQQEKATVALVEEIIEFLDRARHNPTVRYKRSEL